MIVAGGGEAISTAPWRIAKPKSLYQLPHFMALEPAPVESPEELLPFEASEEYTRKLGISRARQDAYALHSHLRAEAARSTRRFVGEIVPLRANADEARDQSAVEPALEELERLTPYVPPDGTLTPGNTSALHDGAAFVVVVSERVWTELGKPHALKLVASAAQGVAPEEEAGAPIEVMKKLLGRMNGLARDDIALIEMSESSAAQAIALSERLELDLDRINPDGGALVRGHPLGCRRRRARRASLHRHGAGKEGLGIAPLRRRDARRHRWHGPRRPVRGRLKNSFSRDARGKTQIFRDGFICTEPFLYFESRASNGHVCGH